MTRLLHRFFACGRCLKRSLDGGDDGIHIVVGHPDPKGQPEQALARPGRDRELAARPAEAKARGLIALNSIKPGAITKPAR